VQPEDPTTRDRIRSEQVRSLLSHTPAAIFAHLFYDAAVVVLLWGRAPPFMIGVFLASGTGLGVALAARRGHCLAGLRGGGGAAAAELASTSVGPVQPPAATLRGAHILVLDDELAILSSMRELLEHWGCRVVTVADTEAALAAARDQTPDLLIVDHRLAESGTGLTAVARLRAAVGVALPALVITGETVPERLREAQQSGYPLLQKPVQPARLRAVLQALLAGSRPQHATAGGPAADR
jgi:CheY-like chemotaxis protein